jgi:hypothetical protein
LLGSAAAVFAVVVQGLSSHAELTFGVKNTTPVLFTLSDGRSIDRIKGQLVAGIAGLPPSSLIVAE